MAKSQITLKKKRITYNQLNWTLSNICKVLFKDNITTIYNNEMKDVYIKLNKDSEYIHWFEFCLLHVIPRFKRFGIEIDYWFILLPDTHIQWGDTKSNNMIEYLEEKIKQHKVLSIEYSSISLL